MGLELKIYSILLFVTVCDGNVALFKKISDFDIQLEEDALTDQMNELFAYVMPHTRCYNLLHDDSLFSDFFIDRIYKAKNSPPAVIAEQLGIRQYPCEGYVVVTSRVQNVPRMIEKLPKWADHRILIITEIKSNYYFQKLIHNQKDVFGDADSFVYTINYPSSGYRLGQPIREFKWIDNMTEPWEEMDEEMTDFLGRNMSVMTANCSMFSKLKWPVEDSHNASHFDGIEMKILRSMSKRLNLTLDYHIPSSFEGELTLFTQRKWYREPLAKKKVDMAFCGLLISLNKDNSDIEMSEPLYQLCFRFVVPRPNPRVSEWYSIFTPFSATLWFFTAGVVGITAVVLQRVSIKSNKYVGSTVIQYANLGRSMLQLVSILVLSSVPHSIPTQGAARHILTWWALFTVLLTTSFSSSLVSHLTNQRYSSHATEIKQFIERGYKWAYLEKPDFNEILDLEDNILNQRWRFRAYQVRSVADYLNVIKDKKHILFGAQIRNAFTTPNDGIFIRENVTLDEFETSPTCFAEYSDGFAFRQGSPFYRSFNFIIQQYKEYGILNKMAWQVQTARARRVPLSYRLLMRTKSGIAPPRGLRIENFTGILEVWAVGLTIAILVFALEMLQRFHI